MAPLALKQTTDLPLRRDEIPAIYGTVFNNATWNAGYVPIDSDNVILFVTESDYVYGEQGMGHDGSFLWCSQNSTTPESKRGKDLQRGIYLHVWTRPSKRANGGRFTFQGVYTVASFTQETRTVMTDRGNKTYRPMLCKLERI